MHHLLRTARFGTVALVVITAACGTDSGGTTGPGGEIADIEITLSNSVEALRTTSAVATARNSRGDVVQTAYTWSSSNPSVASVANGVVRAHAPGATTITARAGNVEGSKEINVITRNVGSTVANVRISAGMPGMGAALVTRDGIIALGVAGVRRMDGATPVTAQDSWHLGSNLKAITAMLAGIAVDRGRISWTTTVPESFPELDADILAAYRDVTLEDLLSNRGGIRNDPPGAAYAGTTARQQRESLVAWALSATPAVARGTFHYSNPGFVIAGAMIERAMNGTYEDLVTSEIAAPLGVNGIGWGPTTTAGGSDQPVGHRLMGGTWTVCEACDNPPGLSAAGRAHMPLATWARIIQEMLRAASGTSSLLSSASANRIFSNQVGIGGAESYGLGWVMTTRPWAGGNGRTATHDGSNTVNHSVAWLGLANGIALLAVTNAADLNGGLSATALDQVASQLLALYLNSTTN